MIQAGEGQGLFAEAAAGGLVTHYAGGQELNGNFTLQVFVVGAVHNSHSAFADTLDEAVVAEGAAGNGLGGHTSLPGTESRAGCGPVAAGSGWVELLTPAGGKRRPKGKPGGPLPILRPRP